MTEKKLPKPKQRNAPEFPASRKLEVSEEPGESMDRLRARLALGATIPNASTALDYSLSIFPELNLNDCAMQMKSEIQTVNGGSLEGLEGILAGQAMALNAIFNNFAKRAAHTDTMQKLEAFMKLAFKAQSQCRTTIEALGELKQPRSATFIKQANIAGQQQVNNGVTGDQGGAARPHEKTITPPNELLTEGTHATLDAGGTGAAICADPGLETVGAVNRAH